MLLGVDGGGTKTDVVLADLRGLVVESLRVGCTNHESVGMDAAVAELRRGVERALESVGVDAAELDAAVFGLAGVDWPSDDAAWNGALDDFGLGGRRLVINDSRLALRAGATSGWGIVSIAGTGSVTAGVTEVGEWFRTMSVGWGEPCGAASLVIDALHAIAAAHHRVGPPTTLSGRFLEALSLDSVPELFEGTTRGRLKVDNRHAPLVARAAAEGDAVAIRLVERSGVAHASMAVGVADRLGIGGEPFELVTAGGVHAAGGLFEGAFRAHVRARLPSAMVVPLHRPPVDGAVLLGLDLLAE